MVNKNRASVAVSCFAAVFFAVMLLWAPRIHASAPVFENEYTYAASGFDDETSSRIIAHQQVKLLLLRELGAYLENSYINKAPINETAKSGLRQALVSLAAGVVGTEAMEEKWDGHTFWLKERITADPQQILPKIVDVWRDEQKIWILKESGKRSAELMKEIATMQKEPDAAQPSARAAQMVKYEGIVRQLSAEDWFTKGYTHYVVDEHQQALDAYSKAMQLHPENAVIYFAIGNAYRNYGEARGEADDLRKAIENYSKAIEFDPKFAYAYCTRAGVYWMLGEHQREIEDYTTSIKIDPRYPVSYYNRGLAFHHRGEFKRAIEDFTNAIERAPQFEEAYQSRGLAHARLGDQKRAIEDYTKAIEIYPNNGKAYARRGFSYADLRDYERAIENYNRAIQIEPNDKKTYVNRGVAYYNLGSDKLAIDDYTKAIELDPKDGMSFYNRAVAYFRLDNFKQAIADFRDGARLGNKDSQEFLIKRNVSW